MPQIGEVVVAPEGQDNLGATPSEQEIAARAATMELGPGRHMAIIPPGGMPPVPPGGVAPEMPDNEPAPVETQGQIDSQRRNPIGSVILAPEPVQLSDPAKDRADLAELIKYRVEAGLSDATSREVMQYKMIHPELSVEAITQNLDQLRLQARSKNTNWEKISAEHPVLTDYIRRDPATMSLALGQSAAIQSIQTSLGGMPVQAKGLYDQNREVEQGFNKVTGAIHGFGEQLAHGAYYGSREALYGFGQAFATGFAMADEAIGNVLGIKNGGAWWRNMSAYYAHEAAGAASLAHIDTHGDSLKNASWSVRTLAEVADATASFLPYAAEMSAAAAAGATPLIFNTIMQAGQIFRTSKEKGATDSEALTRTIVGAPLVGKVMELSPLSKFGNAFTSATTQRTIDHLLEMEAPSIGRMAWTTFARGGIDAASGQVSLGLQRASMQLATASTTKQDLREVPAEFFRGLADPSLLGFHAIGVLSSTGKLARSYESVKQIDSLFKAFNEANPDAAETMMREDAAKRVAAQAQAHPGVYYSLQEFLSEADRLGKEPRAYASELFNDGGAAYDVAVMGGHEHLLVPPDRLEAVVRSEVGPSFKKHGKTAQDLHSRAEVEGQAKFLHKTFEEEYAAAAKIDPENLKPEDEKLYRAAQAITKMVEMEGAKIPNIIAEVRTYAKWHPELTHEEIFGALYGPGGAYAKEARGAKVIEGAHPSNVKAEAKVVARGDLAWEEPAPQTTYTHPGTPLRLVSYVDKADPRYVTPVLDVQGEGTPKSLDEIGNKGHASALYTKAIEDAQAQGKGFRSDTMRTDATEKMYTRLRKAGLPFKLEKDAEGASRWTLSPEVIKELDLDRVWHNLTSSAGSKASGVLKVYHGGPAGLRLIDPYLVSKRHWEMMAADHMNAGKGAAFFSTNPDVADTYRAAGTGEWGVDPASLYSAEVRLKDPLVVDAEGKHWKEVMPEALKQATGGGYDGLIVRNVSDSALKRKAGLLGDTVVPFHHQQIKNIKEHGSVKDLPPVGVRESNPSTVRLIELAEAKTGRDDPRWYTIFKDEQAALKAKEEGAAADASAHGALRDALIQNDRRFMDDARDSALKKAKEVMAQDPAMRVAKLARDGWEGTTHEQKKELTRDGGQPYRLHYDEVEAQIGPDRAKALAEKYPSLVAKSAKISIAVDAAAQILGYEHSDGQLAGRKMLYDLLKAPDEAAEAQRIAQLVLDQRYGPDLTSNPAALMGAALDATHTPEATTRLLGLYRRLASDLDPTTRARSAMTPELWHEHAERLLGLKLLGEIDPHYFAEAEGRATKRALDILDGKGEDPAARAAGAKHVESALLYHHLYLAAREATNTLGAARRRLARGASSDLPVARLGFADTTDPSIGTDGMNSYQRARQGALAAIGLVSLKQGTEYGGAVDAVVARAAEVGHYGYLSNGFAWDPAVIQRVIDNQSGWAKLTPDEARQIHAFVTNLENLGAKRGEPGSDRSIEWSRQVESYITNDGIRAPGYPLEASKIVDQSVKSAGVKGALEAIGRVPKALLDMHGMRNTPDTWTVALLLKKMGPVGDQLLAGLQEAILNRHELMDALYKPWKEIYDRTMSDPKVFKVAEGAFEMLAPGSWGQADGLRLSYADLMNLARWYGDADGRRRVLQGFKLTPDKIEKTLAKYLSKEDLANIQAEKDLIDKEWFPRLAQKQMERTGTPMRRSQAMEFTINGEKYRGGHVTLSYDDRAGMGLDPRRSLADSTLGTFRYDAVAYNRAVMESSFLQERSGMPVGAHPDLGTLTTPQTMADMAHHLAVGDFLHEATNTLLNPSTTGVIGRYYGPDAVKAVEGWLKRTATEMRGGPEQVDPGTRASTKAMRIVRNAVVTAAVTGKITIPLAHATHPFMVGVMEHGWGYAAKYTLPAFTEMMNSLPNLLATGKNEYVERHQAESAYLRQRASETPQDIAELYFDRELEMAGVPKATVMKIKDGMETFGAEPLRQMDEIFSATIYDARKRHYLTEHPGDEMGAIKAAEAETFKAMPNFAAHTRSGFASTKGGYQSVITPFMGYYATVRDLYRSGVFDRAEKTIREHEKATGLEAPLWYRAGVAGSWKARLTVPVVMGLTLGAFLKGAGPKQEDDAPPYMSLDAGEWQREWGVKTGTAALDAGRASIIAMSELVPYGGTLATGMTDLAAAKIKEEKLQQPRTQTNILFSPFENIEKGMYQSASERFGPGDAALTWGKAIAPAAGLPSAAVSTVGGMAVNYDEFLSNLSQSKTAQMMDFTDRMVFPHYYGRAARYQPTTPLSLLKDQIEAAVATDKKNHRYMPW